MDLVVSPAGHLIFENNVSEIPVNQTIEQQISKAFTKSVSLGLLEILKVPTVKHLPPAFGYWRNLSECYLHQLCLDSDSNIFTPPSPDGIIGDFLDNIPPMKGGEYIDRDVIVDYWQQLNDYFSNEFREIKSDIRTYIGEHFPKWSGVGRVCFHLAENKQGSAKPFVFLATYATRLSERARLQYLPLGNALADSVQKKEKEKLLRLLKPIQEAAEEAQLLRTWISEGKIYRPTAISIEEAYQYFKEVGEYEKAGIIIKMPNWWKGTSPPRAKVTVRIGEAKKKSLVGFDGLVDFDIGVSIGDQTLSASELKKILASNQNLVFMKGQWVEVDQEKISKVLSKWEEMKSLKSQGISFTEAMRLISGLPNSRDATVNDQEQGEIKKWTQVIVGKELSKTLRGIREPGSTKISGLDSSLKQNLKTTLRPYQESGVSWLCVLYQLGLGGCLADDMGLGKTIQMISLFLFAKKIQSEKLNALLVVPASLIGNWSGELEKFAPSISFQILHSSSMAKSDFRKPIKKTNNDVVITTYGMVKRIPWLKDRVWDLLVIDEAQAIKNSKTGQTLAVKKLKSRSSFALTGTPIENRLADLWSIFDYSCPGLLGTTKEFGEFIKQANSDGMIDYRPLRSLISPYILRRKKTDKSVISDLPDKTEVKAYCSLSNEQVVLYQNKVQELTQIVENKDISGIQRKGLILSYLMKFKQICNHPSQYNGDNAYDYDQSGKFSRLREIAETISSRGEKVLVFTQFRELTDILEGFLSEIFGRSGLILHGGTAVKKRKDLVKSFQQDGGPPFFVLSIKAGGTGLNLTHASHVIHFDRWWNPAVENQATDRAFRIGQNKNVMVHKFVCRGTVEEKIDAMIQQKQHLADEIVENTGEIKFTELSDKDLLNLVKLDVGSIIHKDKIG
jgi:SNF2 family DNA or RNA helicase